MRRGPVVEYLGTRAAQEEGKVALEQRVVTQLDGALQGRIMERDGPASAVVTEGIHTAEASVGGNQMLHHRPHLCIRHRCPSRSVHAVSRSPTAAGQVS